MNKIDKTTFDIAIIGGGPAGSSAAFYLSKLGFDVCIFEKKEFPRETICGEFLSLEVIAFLKETELFNSFLQLKPNLINKVKVYDQNSVLGTNLYFTAYGIKRGKFDMFLLRRAADYCTKVFQPAEVKSIEINSADNYSVLFEYNKKLLKITAKEVIAAYGKRNVLDKHLNRKFVSSKSRLNGVKFHISKERLSSYNQNTISIFIADDIYCGINCVDDEMATICFLKNDLLRTISAREHVLYLCKQNKFFGELLQKVSEEELNKIKLYGAGDIHFGKKEIVQNGIFMIGDAARVIAPLIGDGIGCAVQNAKLLSEIINEKVKKNLKRNSTEEIYKHEWHKLFNKRFQTANLIQHILFNKKCRKAAIKLINKVPSFLTQIVKMTRAQVLTETFSESQRAKN
ncbi:NAD(P)/FAD-dependent oxidoreductase [Melioribacteraceae bacterium 4301-Me]|uniref:NAD(P)/FAD-dependent oxidoreductase n=1 Tax=Pyranulibacter aquaticus TaxID=3163344 RepID=UPI00359B2929